jgi:hypothetical protein
MLFSNKDRANKICNHSMDEKQVMDEITRHYNEWISENIVQNI